MDHFYYNIEEVRGTKFLYSLKLFTPSVEHKETKKIQFANSNKKKFNC